MGRGQVVRHQFLVLAFRGFESLRPSHVKAHLKEWVFAWLGYGLTERVRALVCCQSAARRTERRALSHRHSQIKVKQQKVRIWLNVT